jgi:hypothetical protein
MKGRWSTVSVGLYETTSYTMVLTAARKPSVDLAGCRRNLTGGNSSERHRQRAEIFSPSIWEATYRATLKLEDEALRCNVGCTYPMSPSIWIGFSTRGRYNSLGGWRQGG